MLCFLFGQANDKRKEIAALENKVKSAEDPDAAKGKGTGTNDWQKP